jgi:hypothetical protein
MHPKIILPADNKEGAFSLKQAKSSACVFDYLQIKKASVHN